jgi:hypothetical protein
MKSIRSRGLFAALPLLLALAPAVKAQASCSLQNATLSGSYVISGTGSYAGAPFALVGRITYDGQGKASLTYSASISGVTYSGVNATGTYTVNSDCTGSKTLTDSTGATTHYDFVIAPDGSTITWIQTDSFTSVVGTAARLERKN